VLSGTDTRTVALILRDGPLDRRVQALRWHDPRTAVATNPQPGPALRVLCIFTHQFSHSTKREVKDRKVKQLAQGHTARKQ